MKKVFAALALAPMAVFAEGTSIVDASAVNTAVGQIKTDLTGFVNTNIPVILGIAGAFLGFWLIRVIIRLVKGAGK